MKHRPFFCSIILICAFFTFPLSPTSASVIATTDIGVQIDYLRWNITTPDFHPNILSELTFKATSPMGRLNLGWFPENKPWWVTAQYGFGKVVDGSVKDEDFALDDKNGIFSRSKHDSNNHNVQTGIFRVGYGWLGSNRFWISPNMGFQWQFSRFKIEGGKRTIPDNDIDYSQLNSVYSAQWMALTIGTIIHYELSSIPLILSADANFFPFADYTGKGRWNLRADFAQDPSFEHDAVGMGGSIELQAQYRFASHWRTGMGWRGQWFEATDGTDTTFFSDGSKVSIPLNKVVQQTMFFFLNLSYQW